MCPGHVTFSLARGDYSPRKAPEFVAAKDAATLARDSLARDSLARDETAFSAAFHKSPMKRAKLGRLQRNAAIVLENASK